MCKSQTKLPYRRKFWKPLLSAERGHTHLRVALACTFLGYLGVFSGLMIKNLA